MTDPAPTPEPDHCGNHNYYHQPHHWLALTADNRGVTRHWCRGTGPTAEPQPGQADGQQ